MHLCVYNSTTGSQRCALRAFTSYLFLRGIPVRFMLLIAIKIGMLRSYIMFQRVAKVKLLPYLPWTSISNFCRDTAMKKIVTGYEFADFQSSSTVLQLWHWVSAQNACTNTCIHAVYATQSCHVTVLQFDEADLLIELTTLRSPRHLAVQQQYSSFTGTLLHAGSQATLGQN